MRHREDVPPPLIATFFALLGMAVATVAQPSYKVLYSPTDSVPRGWYALRPALSLPVGALVLVRLPDLARRLADARRYLPATVPALKYIAANSGDRVCERRGEVMINGELIARARSQDGAGRVLSTWSGCRALAADELFLLNPRSDASFDSRYFGPVSRTRVIGVAFAIRTW